jgi:hypothetical protein
MLPNLNLIVIWWLGDDGMCSNNFQPGLEYMVKIPDPVPTGCRPYTVPKISGCVIPNRIAPYPPMKSPRIPRESRSGNVLKFAST